MSKQQQMWLLPSLSPARAEPSAAVVRSCLKVGCDPPKNLELVGQVMLTSFSPSLSLLCGFSVCVVCWLWRPIGAQHMPFVWSGKMCDVLSDPAAGFGRWF